MNERTSTLLIVFASLVFGFGVYELIFDYPRIEVGHCYVMEDKNPFAKSKIEIKILAVKNGYAQYVYLDHLSAEPSSQGTSGLSLIFKPMECPKEK